MKTLKEYILNKGLPQEFDEDLNTFWNIKDIDTWLFETYDESMNISEDEFYNRKYSSNYIDLPKYWYWQRKLYETLSHSLKTTDTILLRLLKKLKNVIQYETKGDLINIQVNDEFDIESKEFKTFLNFINYHISNKYIDNNIVTIEPRITDEIDYDNEYAYHVTSKWNYEKIKKNGLIPKSKSTLANYDLRIYLWLPHKDKIDDNLKYLMKSYGRMMLRLYKMYNVNDKHDYYDKIDINDAVILRINLKEFEKDHRKKMKLFGDPQTSNNVAVYTFEPIPTKYIEKIEFTKHIKT